MKFFDSRSSGEIVTRINNLDSLEKIISSGISSLLIDLSTIIIAFYSYGNDFIIFHTYNHMFCYIFVYCFIFFVKKTGRKELKFYQF